MKEPVKVYVFDFDGVLCDIGKFEMDARVRDHIAGLLNSGVYYAINTGRAYDRVETECVALIRAAYPTLSLDHLMATTEMGGEVTTFNNGQPMKRRTKYALSQDDLAIFYDVWEAHKADLFAMYVYESKQSMATTVRDHHYDEATYMPQKVLFERLLHEAYAGRDVIITGTTESTDVHAPEAGKNAGAANIIEWLAAVSDIRHDTAICFGDSHSDYEMAREFAQQGFATTFVYTGEGLEVANPHDKVTVVDTVATYTNGTVEYFSRV